MMMRVVLSKRAQMSENSKTVPREVAQDYYKMKSKNLCTYVGVSEKAESDKSSDRILLTVYEFDDGSVLRCLDRDKT